MAPPPTLLLALLPSSNSHAERPLTLQTRRARALFLASRSLVRGSKRHHSPSLSPSLLLLLLPSLSSPSVVTSARRGPPSLPTASAFSSTPIIAFPSAFSPVQSAVSAPLTPLPTSPTLPLSFIFSLLSSVSSPSSAASSASTATANLRRPSNSAAHSPTVQPPTRCCGCPSWTVKALGWNASSKRRGLPTANDKDDEGFAAAAIAASCPSTY